ncbi:hypothetical protein [Bacillus alkalicellulosilyticus]|uniref:hypothetical protein n=1 Tax=Alkalihalobacterium alkalicellulosilyticum TaxID=1912214 RepID=UPI001482836F|nr:hypothetical protein [Bacillus alkalicellulosilyticus]
MIEKSNLSQEELLIILQSAHQRAQQDPNLDAKTLIQELSEKMRPYLKGKVSV